MKIRHRILFFIPLVVVSAGIFWASQQAMPIIEIKGIDFGDKLLHAAAYFFYGAAVLFGFSGYINDSGKRKILLMTLFFGALYAASDEIHQHFIPGRTMDFFDWIADFTGILLSLLLFKPVNKIVNALIIKDDKKVEYL
jgi:VanZ family protein